MLLPGLGFRVYDTQLSNERNFPDESVRTDVRGFLERCVAEAMEMY